MVLRYMISDVDLAEGNVVTPDGEVVQEQKGVARPKKEGSSPKKNAKFWLLLAGIIVFWMLSYYLWRNDGELPSWKQLRYTFLKATNKLMVQGIIYNTESPYALIHGKVVHEGETISGYTVVKIHKDRVEFEKNGKKLTKQLLK